VTAVLPPRTATYNPAAVRDWLRTVHSGSAGHVWIGSTHDKFKGRAWNTADPHWVEAAGAYVDHLDRADAAGIYLRTTSLKAAPAKRGGDHDSLTLPGVAADLDIDGPGHKTDRLALPLPPDEDTARAIIDETGFLTPSVWVHSGGGMYAWWLLAQPHPIADTARAGRFTARWQNIIRAAAERLGHHYGPVGDLSRILRIPGTVNRKVPDNHAPCRVVGDTGIRYSLRDLVDNLNDAEEALPAEVMPVAVITPRPASAGDDLKPGEAYEQQTDWADILGPHGWTLHSQRGRTRYWTRPGKDRRDGFSASTGRAADRDRLYVFSDATEFEARKPYTKFTAHAILEHRGDHAAAARELRGLGYGARPMRRAAA
jgi:hypothetical protein